MQRIQAINPENAEGKTKQLLNGIQSAMGMIPNIYKVMAHSPATLDGILKFNAALTNGVLPEKLGEKIALRVSMLNKCEYCLAAHGVIARQKGLSDEEIAKAENGIAEDAKEHAVLTFAGLLVEKTAEVKDDDLAHLREIGVSDGEIIEIVGHVLLSTFTNYVNHVVDTDIDFPKH